MANDTTFLIRYNVELASAFRQLQKFEQINATIAQNISKNFGEGFKILSNNLTKINSVPIFNAQGVKTGTETFAQFTALVENAQGKLKTVTTQGKLTENGFTALNQSIREGGKVTRTFADDIFTLGSRALLTIPIWIALRGAITGLFGSISNGVKDLIAFDLALQKIRNNLQGTPAEVEASFKKIRDTITETSKVTGISTEELAGAVKQFATLGFSANESLQGALGASKLSIALFGNASDTAEAFAKALNILIDRSNGAKSAVDQMNEAFALTSQLEETNNFEIKAATEALNKFAGTAAGVGLTLNQTLQVLAALGTAGRSGSEGATLLSTSFNTLLKNIPKLTQSLGLVVTTGESTFSIFTRILDKITELNRTPGGRNAAIEAISDVFGGAKGIKIVQSLVAVKDILDQNIAILPNFNSLNEKVGRTLNSESGQAKILGNNLKETGKAFVTAIVGTEDFTSSLIQLNKAVDNIREGLKPLGSVINTVFDNLGLIAGVAFLIKFQSIVTVEALLARILATQATFSILGTRLALLFSAGFLAGLKNIGTLAIAGLATGFRVASFGTVFAGLGKALLSPLSLILTVVGKVAADTLTNAFIQGIQEKDKVAQQQFNQLIDGLRGGLAIPDLTALIQKLTLELKPGDLVTAREIGALRARLQKQIEAGTIQAQVPVDVTPLVSFKDRQAIAKLILDFKTDELRLNGATNSQILAATELYSQQLGIVEQFQDKLKRIFDTDKAINEENKKLVDTQKTGLIANQLEVLRLQGATNLQLTQARIQLEQIHGINQDRNSLLLNELELNKEVTKERLNQNNLSSTSLKLAQIGQQVGIQGAKAISDLLNQKIPLSAFEAGGKFSDLFKILQDQFAAEVEQIQAQRFLFEGRGTAIPIPERTAIQNFQPQPLSTIPLPPINTQIGSINVEVQKFFDDKNTAQEILTGIIEAIQSNPTIINEINKKIDEF